MRSTFKQRERVQCAGNRPGWRRLQRAGVARRQDDQASRAARDGDSDRSVTRDRAVGEIEAFDLYRREGGRDCRRCEDRLRDGSFRQDDSLTGEKISGDDVQRDLRLLEVAIRHVRVDQPAHAVCFDQKVAPPDKTDQCSQRDRKYVLPAQRTPDRGELLDALCRRHSGVKGGVHGADTGADDHIRHQAVRNERTQHADLHGAKAAAPREHKGGLRIVRHR